MKNKKCAAGAATPNSAIALRCGSSSCLTKSIVDMLPKGKRNAVKMSALAAALHTSERDVRRLIHEARCSGAVIIGDNHGYYIPETREELLPYYFTARKRSVSGLKALKAVKRKLEEFNGQQFLGELSNGKA